MRPRSRPKAQIGTKTWNSTAAKPGDRRRCRDQLRHRRFPARRCKSWRKRREHGGKQWSWLAPPGSSEGTAFVISRKYRLLATNAHVADVLAKTGSMAALYNGAVRPCKVDRVWYHPGVVRKHDSGWLVRSQDPSRGPVKQPCPDVAVLQLADGPDLPAEVTLASPQELEDLFAQPVGELGFAEYDNHEWPAAGETPQPTYRSGVVSRLTSFSGAANGPSRDLQLVQHTSGATFGFSGSPIFLANGHVVAIDAAGYVHEKENIKTNVNLGVRIDCLWELLWYHRLAERMNLAVGRDSVDLRRYEQPDPKEHDVRMAMRLVRDANRLILEGRYGLACEYCNRALHLVPGYGKAYQARSEACARYAATHRDTLPYEEMEAQLNWALADASRCLKASPEPEALLNLCLRRLWLQSLTQKTPRSPEIVTLMTKLLDRNGLSPEQRGYAYGIRAIATDYDSNSLGDLNKAVELAQYGRAGRVAYEARATFCERYGRFEQASADRQRSMDLLAADRMAAEASDLLAEPYVSSDDSKKALELMEQACQITRYGCWSHLDLLAKAYQCVGKSELACVWGDKSLGLAPEGERLRLLADLNAYRSGASPDDEFASDRQRTGSWDSEPIRSGEPRQRLLPTSKHYPGPESQGYLPEPGGHAPDIAPPRLAPSPKPGSADIMRRLEEAKRSFNEGSISEEQYEARKRQIVESF